MGPEVSLFIAPMFMVINVPTPGVSLFSYLPSKSVYNNSREIRLIKHLLQRISSQIEMLQYRNKWQIDELSALPVLTSGSGRVDDIHYNAVVQGDRVDGRAAGVLVVRDDS